MWQAVCQQERLGGAKACRRSGGVSHGVLMSALVQLEQPKLGCGCSCSHACMHAGAGGATQSQSARGPQPIIPNLARLYAGLGKAGGYVRHQTTSCPIAGLQQIVLSPHLLLILCLLPLTQAAGVS